MNSKRYLYMRGTIQALLELGAIPIVNENDAVSADEIKIGDNDTLSAIVASVAEADLLIILSDIQGLYTKDPKSHPDAELIHEVPAFSRELLPLPAARVQRAVRAACIRRSRQRRSACILALI